MVSNDEALAQRCRALKLILTDVDGVMTDGTVLLLPDGQEAKSFHIRDGLAIVMARRAGLLTGLLSGRVSEAVARRAAELEMAVVRQGISNKGAALREILAEQGLTAQEVAYIGDDLNDLPVMNAVALSAAPADAPFEVRAQAFMIMEARGGGGCLREFVEAILRARGDWERAAAAVGVLAP
ncbi:MAG TPA: HAD-IIIA family hydrolase [Vicinamibacteria bacterium]|jgi:3-deoxy-D-manno-octulosonate 8-phosphate phosphatase (KDO 8-P phosphatase)|nr:HAD-IIIA family hydrolase [Vicinamibacteria bacterium]